MTKAVGLPRAKRVRRRTDSPSKHVARITWILLTLLYDGVLDYASCIDRFGISRREFQRDLLKLREIGETRGFTIPISQAAVSSCSMRVPASGA